MVRRMNDVLHAVQQEWSCLANVEKSLDAENALAMAMQQHRQPETEHTPIEWLVKIETERCNVPG